MHTVGMHGPHSCSSTDSCSCVKCSAQHHGRVAKACFSWSKQVLLLSRSSTSMMFTTGVTVLPALVSIAKALSLLQKAFQRMKNERTLA